MTLMTNQLESTDKIKEELFIIGLEWIKIPSKADWEQWLVLLSFIDLPSFWYVKIVYLCIDAFLEGNLESE